MLPFANAMAVGLRHLRYFVAVAEAGQVTAAARRLYVSQPAMSLALRELERDIGAPLLRRHPGGVALTEVGEQLLADARAALDLVDAALTAARDAGRWTPGSLTIGVLPYSMAVLHPLLERFREAHPRASAQVQQLDFATQLAGLRAGRVDAELVTFVPEDPELVVLPLISSPVAVFMASDHRLAGRESVRFEDLAGETWPGRHPSVPIEFADVYWLTARRGYRPKVSAEIPVTPDECWALISAGKAICTSPLFLADAILGPGREKAGMVCSIPVADVDPFVMALARRRDNTEPLVLALFDVAAELAEQLASLAA